MRARLRRSGVIAICAAAAAIAAIGLTSYLTSHPRAHHETRTEAELEKVFPTFVPSCSWPLRVSGKASPEQAGLMRCYLRALARHSTPGMFSVAYRVYPGGIHIARGAFARTADARSGVATIRLHPDDSVDPYYFPVTIIFADGARDSVIMAIANPASIHSWRLQVATPNY